MLDIAASFVTKYCTVYLVTCAAVLSFLFRKRDDSGLVFLLCFTMIFNTILKTCFGMTGPFSKSPTDYAFPSGHMNFDGVFFIWMALYSRYNFARGLYVVIAAFCGWCMVYKGFHYARDVFAAPFFSALSVYCYLKFIDKLPRCSLLRRTLCPISVDLSIYSVDLLLDFPLSKQYNNSVIPIDYERICCYEIRCFHDSFIRADALIRFLR